MQLVLVRHAESVWNAARRWQGQADVELSPRGQLQARALADRLYAEAFDRRYSSDLMRALSTAAALGVVPESDPRLREIDVGAWAGVSHRDVAKRFPEEVAALKRGEPVRIGGGESMPEFENRVDLTLAEIGRRHPAGRTLVVTHGGVIRAASMGVLGLRGLQNPVVGVTNTSLTTFRQRGGRLVLERYNDAVHLPPNDVDSSVFRLPSPALHLALVACDQHPTSRHVIDGVLAGLGIAQYYVHEALSEWPLPEQLLADPVTDADLVSLADRLRQEQPMSAAAVVVTPRLARDAVATLIGASDPEAFVDLPVGAVAQLRVTERGATLHSFGVHYSELALASPEGAGPV